MQPPSKTAFRPPSTADALQRIEARLERLEQLLGPLAVLADAPAVAATAVETLDELGRGREPELDARLRGAVTLLERVSRPQTLAMLHGAVDLVESLPGVASTAVDAVDELADPQRTGLHDRTQAGLALLGRLSQADALQTLRALVDDGQTVLHEARRAGPRRLGLFGLLRAFRDPHAQRALGFAVSALESVGRLLETASTKTPASLGPPRNP